jgi:exopolyphosphatase/guanosine-5'-triphosphate,3'-diphosphate pyrophosphatase
LNGNNLLLLEIASLLHDIGHFINAIDHDKHGYYLLNANRLIGLSLSEQNIVANLVRYHRQASPSMEDEDFKALPQKDRLVIFKLSALLCLADSLDISHTGKVTDVILKEAKTGWRMKIAGEKDLMLVNWALQKRKSHFRDVFGVNLEMG